MGFVRSILGPGVFFAMAWGLTMHFAVWRAGQMPFWGEVLVAAMAGLFFGIGSAFLIRRRGPKS